MLVPSAMIDDSTCDSFGMGHPCTKDADGAMLQSLMDEANRLEHLKDLNCQSLGLNLQSVTNFGGQGVRVWGDAWFPGGDQGPPAEGDFHDSRPNQIHLWGNLSGSELLRTARHEAVHRMNRNRYLGVDDFGSGDPPGYKPTDPSTAMGPGGDPFGMGAYALSDYCGAAT